MPLAADVPPISALTLRLFRHIVPRRLRRHFRSVMLLHPEHMRDAAGPLIVYGNHSSWWDPMFGMLLAQRLMPGRRHYGPIDASALRQYPILRRLGIFPVEINSSRGAVTFLRTAEAILRSGGVLWITPQGRLCDPREAELAFKPGLAALALRVPEARLLPLAVEYTFWNERLPEALGCLAAPFHLTATNTLDATAELEAHLTCAIDELRTASIARDAAPFTTILTGGRGTAGMYGLIQRLRRLLPGSRRSPDHTERPES